MYFAIKSRTFGLVGGTDEKLMARNFECPGLSVIIVTAELQVAVSKNLPVLRVETEAAVVFFPYLFG